MDIKIETSTAVAKTMKTGVHAGDEEIVLCSIAVKGIHATRSNCEELSGIPIGATAPLFNDAGVPWAHMSFLMPKRVLIFTGSIEHRRESGAAIAKLKLTKAIASSLRFNLDMPNDGGPMLALGCTLTWKAAGDEVEDVKALLGKHCFVSGKFEEEPGSMTLFSDSKASPKAEAAAAARNKAAKAKNAQAPLDYAEPEDDLLDKAKALLEAGQTAGSIGALQSALRIGYNRAARLMERLAEMGITKVTKVPSEQVTKTAKALERGNAISSSGGKVVDLEDSRFARDAREKAKRHPRKPTPPKGHR